MRDSHVFGKVIAVTLFLFFAGCAAAQETFVPPEGEPIHTATYRESTAGESVDLLAREWRTETGYFLESVSAAGDRHVVLVDEALDTRAWSYEGDGTSVVSRRRGNAVTLAGRGGGVDGRVDLDESRWIQSIERSLRRFVLSSEHGNRLRFSVVQPDNLSARTLQAQIMEDEEVVVSGRPVAARRVRISLPGIGVLFWRSSYWYRLSDGLFVQSRVTRGPPGTPETLVILMSDSGPAPD